MRERERERKRSERIRMSNVFEEKEGEEEDSWIKIKRFNGDCELSLSQSPQIFLRI